MGIVCLNDDTLVDSDEGMYGKARVLNASKALNKKPIAMVSEAAFSNSVKSVAENKQRQKVYVDQQWHLKHYEHRSQYCFSTDPG